MSFKSMIWNMKRQNLQRTDFNFEFFGVTFGACLSIAESPYQLLIAATKGQKSFGAFMKIEMVAKLYISDEDFENLKKFLGVRGSVHALEKDALYRAIEYAYPDSITQDDDLMSNVLKNISRSKNLGPVTDEFVGFMTLPENKNPSPENLLKTERIFGKEISYFCKKNRTSSRWKHDK